MQCPKLWLYYFLLLEVWLYCYISERSEANPHSEMLQFNSWLHWQDTAMALNLCLRSDTTTTAWATTSFHRTCHSTVITVKPNSILSTYENKKCGPLHSILDDIIDEKRHLWAWNWVLNIVNPNTIFVHTWTVNYGYGLQQQVWILSLNNSNNNTSFEKWERDHECQ